MSYRSELVIQAAIAASRPQRYDQCDDTCTTDCGHCKGQGRPTAATTETATDQDKTLTFPHAIAKRWAELAIGEQQARQETRRRIEGLLRLDRSSHLGRLVEIDEDTYVAEVIDRSPITWAVIIQGRADFRRFYTLDEALLLAVELRNGGGSNDQGHVYAARMLGAGKPAEEGR